MYMHVIVPLNYLLSMQYTHVLIYSQGAKRVVAVDSLSQFYTWIEPSELKLPAATMVFEEDEGKVHSKYVITVFT